MNYQARKGFLYLAFCCILMGIWVIVDSNDIEEILFYRNSHPEVFCKKGVLRNFVKFTGKHLCQSLFFNKVAYHFIKKRDSGTGVFL